MDSRNGSRDTRQPSLQVMSLEISLYCIQMNTYLVKESDQ
jgi:hypothetical protein